MLDLIGQIMVKWADEEVLVEGQVATLPQHFKAGIHIDTTFEELDRAAIVLGHSKDGPIKVRSTSSLINRYNGYLNQL